MTKEKDMEDACHDENRRKIITDIQHTPHEQTNIPGDKIQRNLWNLPKDTAGKLYCSPDTDEYTTAYLKQLRRSPNIIEPPQDTVPTKIFQEGRSNMKECTSDGISGLHIVHLKACSQ